MDILKTIQEEREEFNALPTSEKLKRNRLRAKALLLMGEERLNEKELAYLRGGWRILVQRNGGGKRYE